MRKNTPASLRGYTLVELAIVLVIIGLLAGGVMVGTDMIRSAELRAVVSEYQDYNTAVTTFRERYRALPGDMLKATNYWTEDAGCPGTAVSGEATCDGDGDGRIGAYNETSEAYERFRFWQHLYNAELTNFFSTGIANDYASGNRQETVLEENIPPSQSGGVGWNVIWIGDYESGSLWFDGTHNNSFIIGKPSSGNDTPNYYGGFTPQDAHNIDLKIDDGMPAQGVVTVRYDHSPSCHTGTATNDWDAEYDVGESTADCTLLLHTHF